MATPKIDIPYEKIVDFCRRWKITEFALFGSVLRDDFRPDSDVDVMVTFAPDARWGFKFVQLCEELEELFGREVHVVTRRSVEESQNPFRRNSMLAGAEVIYEAA
ncbi:MAG: nucleotidyltransferase family protein [Armatimonadota bacterium]